MQAIVTELTNLGFKIENHTTQSVLGVWFNNAIVLTINAVVIGGNTYALRNCKIEGFTVFVEKENPNCDKACCEAIRQFCKDLIGARITDNLSEPQSNTAP